MTKNFQNTLFFSLLCSTYLLPSISLASDFETPEYFESAGLKYINASTAYDLGFTGKNILLGELDSGVLFRQTLKTVVLEHDNVFVFAAANSGHLSPAFQAGLPYLMPEISGNWLNVMAFPSKETDAHGFVPVFTHLAKYVEENSLMAPGVNIYSSVSRNTSNNSYENMTGTSMAAPFVTGSLGLVQEAFPYMSGKQLTDTILSTANKTFTPEKFVILHEENADNLDEHGKPAPNSDRLNIIYFGSAPADITQNLTDYYAANQATISDKFPDLNSFLTFDNKIVHQNVPWESVYGQGLLDVGKAVQGPGTLNARRLSTANISTDYGNKQAIYNINTQGYNSVWRNDIDQKPVDQAYIDRSDRKDLADLIGLSVGLQKDGLGTLALTGENTYSGASIANGGTLQIDGSIAGDAYSNPLGTLAGSGTFTNVFNRGTLQAGSWGQVGTMTISGNLESTGNINVIIKDDNASLINVSNSASINGSAVTP